MKAFWATAIIFLILVIGFFTGTYMYKIKNLDDIISQKEIISKVEDECTVISELEELRGIRSKIDKYKARNSIFGKCINNKKAIYDM